MKYLILFLAILLIIIHGFWPNIFLVDNITVGILLILSIPTLAHYLKRAKILGTELEFKEKIKEAKKTVQRSVEKAKEDEKAGKYKILPFETFKTSAVKKLLELESDPSLALASLRIEIEKKLRIIANFLNINGRDKMPLFNIIEELGKNEILHNEQIRALRQITTLCNKAIHGYDVKKQEAEEIISLIDKINASFAVGYSIDISLNENYKKHGLVCEYEHCIEWMPLSEKRTKKSCLLFGHNCPGGTQKIIKCKKTIKDFPENRFIK